ncbi:hypothetical protein F5Y10DRAFT_14679 [Nemania abortiva]|nr:hypothetical protein F5Y10DRAFT_14679 [Nemania abortiva]
MTDQTAAPATPAQQSATGGTPVSRPRSRIVSRTAEALVEAKVQQAVEAFQSGQHKSIRAAATAFGAPYHRTRSRCQGHHSRDRNGRRPIIIGDGINDGVSARTARRRRQKARMAIAGQLPTRNAAAIARPITTRPAPAQPAPAVVRERRPSLTIQAPSEEPASQLSTQDLLRELSKRLDTHEATTRAHIDSLRQSLTAEIAVNLSTHSAQQAEQIERLEREISDLRGALTKEASEEASEE